MEGTREKEHLLALKGIFLLHMPWNSLQFFTMHKILGELLSYCHII